MESAIEKIAQAGLNLEKGWPDPVNPEEQYLNYIYLLHAHMSGGVPDQEVSQLHVTENEKTPFVSIRSKAYSLRHKYFREQDGRRLLARNRWQEYFKNHDAFIMPVAFVPAFPHIDKPWFPHHPDPSKRRILKTPEGERDYDDILFWLSFATLAGLPSTVVPVGLTDSGLPVGMQIVGPFGPYQVSLIISGESGYRQLKTALLIINLDFIIVEKRMTSNYFIISK
jgi:Asp-tRNA(Asn)/Glu-tRNA(Gln) amidotransferase A subunit family amidase